MFYVYHIWFLIPIIICGIISAVASASVRSAFRKNDSVQCRSGLTGLDAAQRLLRMNGVNDVMIGRVGGFLSDHYNPKAGVVNLSESTYSNNSVAAVAVAAHEIGHVMQRKKGYIFYGVRAALVPVVNFGTRLATPLVLIGILLDVLSLSNNPDLGFTCAMIGVILYGGSLLFAFVTLPVELNASKRAMEMLLESGVIGRDETRAVKQVLSAAAFTYLASLLTSIVYFLRFLLQVLIIFGRRNNNR